MPTITFPFHTLRLELDDGWWLGFTPALPGLSRLARRPERLDQRLTANLVQALPTVPPEDLHRRTTPMEIEVDVVEVLLPPPTRIPTWHGELRLTFPVLRWAHGTEAFRALVPTLGLHVLASKPDELTSRLPREITAALQRSQVAASLRDLSNLQRALRLTAERHSTQIDLPTPKRRALDAQQDQEEKKSILDQVGVNLTRGEQPKAYRVQTTVGRLAEALTSRAARSVLLVGPSGVGKTAAFLQLVRERRERGLPHTPMYMTSGSKLVAGQCGYGMWQQRCRDVCREAAKRKAILHLGNLVELMDVGKSEGNPSGVASFLRPYIARGEILAVAECTPEQVPLIEREDPQLIDAFLQIRVEEPHPDDSRTILQLFAYDQPPQRRQALTAEVLDTIERLHRRYATYSAFPGRPLRFLQNLLNDAAPSPTVSHSRDEAKRRKRRSDSNLARVAALPSRLNESPRPLTAADVYDAFTRETGLPRVLLDPAERLDLAAARSSFAARVIGQEDAVNLVTDLIGTVKAGLARPDRPIASLLFVGPTGVGKTEMAKALAEYLFGSAQRLTRFDMSEYSDPIAVQRLVGTAFGSEGLLTAKVREQPFSVILLDEFEKAHPAFFDLLLQVMGEGRLTDAAGRLADFRNSVIILTSNLGAESFQASTVGLATRAHEQQRVGSDHFTRAVQAFLRPEMFNRIDRVVAFTPLPPEVVRQIADRQLELVAQRDGVRYRGLELQIEPSVADHLAEVGYDARYGARPLKRAIERRLLAPLAAKVNEYAASNAVTARVEMNNGDLVVTVKQRLDNQGRPVSSHAALPDLVKVAGELVALRRMYQRMERCWPVMEFRNELFQLDRREQLWLRRLEKLAGRELKNPPKHPLSAAEQAQMASLRELEETLSGGVTGIRTAEDRAMLALHGVAPIDAAELWQAHTELMQRWNEVLRTLYCRRFPNSNHVTITMFSETRAGLFALAAAYVEIAQRHRWRCSLLRYSLPQKAFDPAQLERAIPTVFRSKGQFWYQNLLIDRESRKAILQRWPVDRPESYLREPNPSTFGLAFHIEGEAVFPFFTGEVGLHLFQYPRLSEEVHVFFDDQDLETYKPPEGVTRRGGLEQRVRRRVYDMVECRLQDPHVDAPSWPSAAGFAAVLETGMQRAMRGRMMDLLDE